MPSDVGNTSFVEIAHLEAAFHATNEALNLGAEGILQLEMIAELGIVPVNLGEHLARNSIDSPPSRVGATFSLFVARALSGDFHAHVLQLALGYQGNEGRFTHLVKLSTDDEGNCLVC